MQTRGWTGDAQSMIHELDPHVQGCGTESLFIVSQRGCGIWMLAALCGMFFISSFNWIDQVMEEVAEKVGITVSGECMDA
jgi:hypothetical protein